MNTVSSWKLRILLPAMLVCAIGGAFAAGLGFAPGWAPTIGQGTAIGPGFAPMQRGGVIQVPVADTTINSATFRSNLVLELLPGNWHLTSGKIDTWNDSSGFSPARNATQTTALKQPGINGGLASFTGGQYMQFPQITGSTSSPTVTILKFKLNSGVGGNYDVIGVNDGVNETMCEYGPGNGFDKTRLRLTGTAADGIMSNGVDVRGNTMTIGFYASQSQNKVYFYTQNTGVTQIPSMVYNIQSNNANIIGSQYYPNTADRYWMGTITAAWQWNADIGTATFAQIASIAAAYTP